MTTTPPELSADMSFTLQEVDAMIAVMTGAVQRTPQEVPIVRELLDGLRQRFIEAGVEIRERNGIPVD